MIVDRSCTRFVKSSFSTPTGGNCVEVARLTDGSRAVRDSKNREGGEQVYGPTEWAEFIDALRASVLD
ncbi:MAG TPA: DUF397 domain-containing protein [Candidatus Dormibacteraeota bacterium]|jgi:hypothetical protein|nr:DUF397 domain-containing protein [Candidatus Dormibacteraeota bacterium]